MTKKTVTIEFTIKKWQKMAILAVVLFVASYLMATCAHAQTMYVNVDGTVPTITSTPTTSTYSNVVIPHADIASANVDSLVVKSCIYLNGQPCSTSKAENDNKESFANFKLAWYITVASVLLLLSIILGIGTFFTWHDHPEL